MMHYDVLIPVLAFVAVVCLGGAFIVASASRRRVIEARLNGTSAEAGTISDEDGARPRTWLLRALTHTGSTVSGNKASKSLRQQMARAGFHSPSAIFIYMGAKFTLFVVGIALFAALTMAFTPPLHVALLIILAGSSFMFFLPNFYLELRCSNRALQVRRHLPDVIDLLEISVSGGMGLDMAWNAVGDEVRSVSPLIADEMALANLEMHLGEDRGTAIRHMAERTGADELSSLVAVLVQSQRFGTSVAEALRTFAASMRELRSQRAEEHSEKMAVKMLFPMVIMIFPVVIVVAVGPAAITLVKIFGEF